jgi:ubiquitin-activating enzyme E1 C
MRACLPESLLANIFLSSKVKDCIMIFKWVLANARYFSSVSILGQEEYEEDGSPDLSTIKPMVDGGTEGFKGHARVIIPGITPCFHCSLWLFPPQITFPLCTLAETPRSPAHCIEYAHLIQWGQDRMGEYFDADNPEHMKWIYDQVPMCN